MSEVQMWDYLQARLKPFLHCERLTDRIQEGLPDVLYVAFNGLVSPAPVTGLLELKYLPKLPENLHATPVLTYGSHGLQPEQAFWLNRWARKGGRCGILLRVGRERWFYWRARGEPDWLVFIKSTQAIHNQTWTGLSSGPDFMENLARALCR